MCACVRERGEEEEDAAAAAGVFVSECGRALCIRVSRHATHRKHRHLPFPSDGVGKQCFTTTWSQGESRTQVSEGVCTCVSEGVRESVCVSEGVSV